MKYVLIVSAMILLVTGCGSGDVRTRSQIIGTWTQGQHTLTLATDGTFTSIFPAAQTNAATSFYGSWKVKWGQLMFTNIRSNSIAILDVGSAKIIAVDDHRLDLANGAGAYSLGR